MAGVYAYAMTDKELRDAAVAELKKTTVGYINKKWTVPPVGSQWKKGLDLLAQIGVVIPPPPVTSFSIPTWEVIGNPSSDPIAQTWVLSTALGVPVGQWGGVPLKQMRTPSADPTNGSWEWWWMYQFQIPTNWSQGDEGNAYAFILDPHNVPGDVGWTDVPPSRGTSAMHTKYKAGALLLQHEYNQDIGLPHEFVCFSSIAKGVWHSVLGHTILGRLDGSVPASGHPNAGKGKTRIWLDGGSTPFDTGDAQTLQKNPSTGQVQAKLDILEGAYWPGLGSQHKAQFTLSRWGRTYVEARDNSSFIHNGLAIHADLSLSQIGSRSSSDFVAPPGL